MDDAEDIQQEKRIMDQDIARLKKQYQVVKEQAEIDISGLDTQLKNLQSSFQESEVQHRKLMNKLEGENMIRFKDIDKDWKDRVCFLKDKLALLTSQRQEMQAEAESLGKKLEKGRFLIQEEMLNQEKLFISEEASKYDRALMNLDFQRL